MLVLYLLGLGVDLLLPLFLSSAKLHHNVDGSLYTWLSPSIQGISKLTFLDSVGLESLLILKAGKTMDENQLLSYETLLLGDFSSMKNII